MLLPRFHEWGRHTAATLVSLLLLDGAQGYGQTIHHHSQDLTGYPPCDALIAANLSHIVHLASSPLYPSLVNGTWAPDTRRSPYCFVLPSTTDEVSQVLTALRSAGGGAGNWHVALRSGGHGTDYANNIDDGVTIDLTQLNASSYDKSTNMASIGTGARWGQVYSDLLKYGVSVTGGREGVVGVGGLTLAGGISWYTARTGFACDSVVNYEVVLENGKIINANKSSHSDLWRALKGGGSNFGIVTRFDIEAFPAKNLTIGKRVISMDHVDDFIHGLVEFTNLNQSFQNNALLSVFNYNQQTGNTTISLTEVNIENEASSEAFDTMNRIPTLTPGTELSLTLAEYSNNSALGDGILTVGAGPITIANDPRVIRYVIEQHAGFITDLNSTIKSKNFSTIFDLQPIASYVTDISSRKGGNMLGLERQKRNKLLVAVGAILVGQNSNQEVAQVYQLATALNQRIKAYATSIGGLDEFVYLAYADSAQDPLGSYGTANVKHMQKVAKNYDPHGFFQHRVPGGFKINRVKQE